MRRDVRVGVGAGHLEPHPPVVGDRQQVVDRVQLRARRRPGSARRRRRRTARSAAPGRRAASRHTSTRCSRRTWKVSSPRSTTTRSIASSKPRSSARARVPSSSAIVVEVAAVRARAGQLRRPADHEAAVAGGVAGVLRAEHADAGDRLARSPVRPRACAGTWSAACSGTSGRRFVSGASLGGPLVDQRQRAQRLACSSSSICLSRCAPSFMFWILSCSLTIASSSISGRGGQPGR